MNEEDNNLITFSEAARIRGIKPQSIQSLVERNRLKVEIISGKKFLDRKEVEDFTEGRSGRPPKSKITLKDLDASLGKLLHPEKYYKNVFSVLITLRKQPKNNHLSGEEILTIWENPIWRENRRKLRKNLESYERTWQPDVCCNQILVSKKYKNSIVQEFYIYCLTSAEMYKKAFSLARLKRDFIDYCKTELGLESSDKTKAKEEFDFIISVFNEGQDKGLNLHKNLLRTANITLSNENLSPNQKKERLGKILRLLYEYGYSNTKSVPKVLAEAKKDRQTSSNK